MPITRRKVAQSRSAGAVSLSGKRSFSAQTGWTPEWATVQTIEAQDRLAAFSIGGQPVPVVSLSNEKIGPQP
jgi:hypothetical protein